MTTIATTRCRLRYRVIDRGLRPGWRYKIQRFITLPLLPGFWWTINTSNYEEVALDHLEYAIQMASMPKRTWKAMVRVVKEVEVEL